MSIQRLEQTEKLLVEAIEAIEETKPDPAPASTPVRQALALVREMADEENSARWDVSHPSYKRPSRLA